MLPFYFLKKMKRKQNPQKEKDEALSSFALPLGRHHSLYVKKIFWSSRHGSVVNEPD